jgi:hypothetical protein
MLGGFDNEEVPMANSDTVETAEQCAKDAGAIVLCEGVTVPMSSRAVQMR